MSPIVFSPRALEKKVTCRSFYFDLALLEDYWVRRKYHHTMSASLVYALQEALIGIEEEGLQARWSRHEKNHMTFARNLDRIGLSFLPPLRERLWTLNAVSVPEWVDEAAARKHLLQNYNIEIGAGLGPLAGKIFRIGLMGTSSSQELVVLLSGALEQAINASAVRKA
jgi:alanine-glyoxylate transaminase/serine-glyoxylate transaminase/serine-pyruvate transaminase